MVIRAILVDLDAEILVVVQVDSCARSWQMAVCACGVGENVEAIVVSSILICVEAVVLDCKLHAASKV